MVVVLYPACDSDSLHKICAQLDPKLKGRNCMDRVSHAGETWLCGQTCLPCSSSSVKTQLNTQPACALPPAAQEH